METVKVEIDKDADLYFKCPHCNGITYLTDAACFFKKSQCNKCFRVYKLNI